MRILWLKTELLHPIDKGGKIRTFHTLKHLMQDHHITYLSLDDGTAGQEARSLSHEYCHELVTLPHFVRTKFSLGFYLELFENLFSLTPYAIRKYYSAAMRAEILRRTVTNSYDVLVCDFLAPSANVPDNLQCAAVLFQHNVEAMIWRRYYQFQRNPAKRLYLYEQWRKMRMFEERECRRYDQVIAVSLEDRDVIQTEYGIVNISVVPTGVDTEFFRPDPSVEKQPNSLIFTGSMDWLPNEDAIRFFIDAVLPIVRRYVPDVTLTVVGRDPGSWLRNLNGRDLGIQVTGRVDDVRPFINRAAAYVVPIRIGGGTRLKIYEAMAMEMPIISTSVGVEGLPVRHLDELLLADEPEAFAANVVRALQDRQYASALGRRAADRVRGEFGWRSVANEFEAACRLAMASRAAPRGVGL